MSRSYKKFPFCKCENSCKSGKKFANKKVRRHKKEISNGRSYKKLYESWDICDYRSSMTWQEWQEWCHHPRWWGRKQEEPIYYEWYRAYKRK